jgi:hypothetical protein
MRSARTYLMKRIKSFNDFNGTLPKKTTPASPCREKFESVVFGDLLAGGSEHDTTREAQLSMAVMDWFNSGSAKGRQAGRLVAAFKELLACRDEYPNELAPTADSIYRGMEVKYPQLMRWLGGAKTFERRKVGSRYWAVTQPFPYQAKAPLESWTAQPYIAYRFATTSYEAFDRLAETGAETRSGIGAMAKLLRSNAEAVVAAARSGRSERLLDGLRTLVEGMGIIANELKSEYRGDHGVVFVMTPDERCVLNPAFSNRFAYQEHEVVRVDGGGGGRAQLLFPLRIAVRIEAQENIKKILKTLPDFGKSEGEMGRVLAELRSARKKLEKLL